MIYALLVGSNEESRTTLFLRPLRLHKTQAKKTFNMQVTVSEPRQVLAFVLATGNQESRNLAMLICLELRHDAIFREGFESTARAGKVSNFHIS